MNEDKKKSIWNLIDHKISLSGFIEQSYPYRCPGVNDIYCDKDMTFYNIVGYGEYPKGRVRDSINPNLYGVGFECPYCFTKSACHMEIETIKTIHTIPESWLKEVLS